MFEQKKLKNYVQFTKLRIDEHYKILVFAWSYLWTVNNLLAQPYSNTNFGSLAFQSTAPKIWNKLPLEIKSTHSLQT